MVVKPNLAYPYPPPATTDPSVVEAVARLCVEAGAREVMVGDSSSYSCKNILGYGRWSNMDVIRSTGMDRAAERAGAKIVDFDSAKWATVTIPGGVILRRTEIASPMLEADVVVNVPAMKTHLETLATLAIKNYHGIIPDRWKIQFHKDEISQKIVDVHKAVKTHLVVMDGLLGMEGLGPRMGSPVRMDLILASSDTVAIDAVTSQVMGIEPDEVETTRLARTQGIGNGSLDSIQTVGLGIGEVRRPFRRPDVRISGIFPGVTVIQGGPASTATDEPGYFSRPCRQKVFSFPASRTAPRRTRASRPSSWASSRGTRRSRRFRGTWSSSATARSSRRRTFATGSESGPCASRGVRPSRRCTGSSTI